MKTRLKKLAANVATIGGSLSALLAIAVNAAHIIHVPSPDLVILVTIASVVSAVVIEARKLAGAKLAARREAKRA